MPGGRFRRRGGRSRGGGANRGRNGGRADLRQPRFESQRLGGITRPNDDEAPTRPGPESEEDTGAEGEDEVRSDPGEEDESEHDDRAAPTRPYIALLQGFAESSSSRTSKRRKLEHHHDQKRLPESRARGADRAGVEEEAEQQEQGVDVDVDFVEGAENEAEGEDEGHHMAAAGLQAEQPEGQNSDDDSEGGEAGRADPFDSHFAHPDEEAATRKIQAIQTDGWETRPLPASSLRLAASIPKGTTDWSDRDVTTPVLSPDALNLRQKLRVSSSKKMPSLDRLQQQLAPILFNYHDVLFGDRTARNADSLRRLVCLHVLNHILKAHHRIINHSYRLARDGGANPDLEFRDQGFTRPKVLFLLPTRHSCLRVVNTLRDLSGPDQEENRRRLDDAFGVPPGGGAAKFGPDKPADFRDLFAGNDDDMFRLGIKFTRKTVKYYTPFYGSDVLLASPLGLRVAMGSDGDRKGGAKLDFDFLSSIEIVVLDQADALLMQNWEHVEFIFEHLNLQPRDAHGCDFGRVRAWYLENQARHYRQTVVLSAFNTPELSELARARCANWSGKLRVQPASYPGVIQQLGAKVRQTFSRFDTESPAADPDSRFAFFTAAVLANLTRRSSSSSSGGGSGGEDVTGTLIFVPSYLDFVRLRNHFATSVALAGVTFGALSEYADVPAASRARSHFSAGRHRVLLYTERAHHFRRYRLRGVRRVLFYGLPDNPHFYAEIAGGFLAASEADGTLEPGRGTVRVVFSRYDLLKLERIAGSERVGRMVGDRGDRFDFV